VGPEAVWKVFEERSLLPLPGFDPGPFGLLTVTSVLARIFIEFSI